MSSQINMNEMTDKMLCAKLRCLIFVLSFSAWPNNFVPKHVQYWKKEGNYQCSRSYTAMLRRTSSEYNINEKKKNKRKKQFNRNTLPYRIRVPFVTTTQKKNEKRIIKHKKESDSSNILLVTMKNISIFYFLLLY